MELFLRITEKKHSGLSGELRELFSQKKRNENVYLFELVSHSGEKTSEVLMPVCALTREKALERFEMLTRIDVSEVTNNKLERLVLAGKARGIKGLKNEK